MKNIPSLNILTLSYNTIVVVVGKIVEMWITLKNHTYFKKTKCG